MVIVLFNELRIQSFPTVDKQIVELFRSYRGASNTTKNIEYSTFIRRMVRELRVAKLYHLQAGIQCFLVFKDICMLSLLFLMKFHV
jgi:hypothetical protein